MSPFEILMLLCFGSAWPVLYFRNRRLEALSGK